MPEAMRYSITPSAAPFSFGPDFHENERKFFELFSSEERAEAQLVASEARILQGISSPDYMETGAGWDFMFLLMMLVRGWRADQKPNPAIHKILKRQEFIEVFTHLYRLPDDLDLIALSFHAAGTTSIILKTISVKFGNCALKIIQAPYMSNELIRHATSGYAANYGMHLKFAPRILQSSPTWIFMEFIEGKNLSDYITYINNELGYMSDEYITLATKTISLLTDALAYYSELSPPIAHGDLTPYNIMIMTEGTRPTGIKLIDFGENYVLQSRVGSGQKFIEAFALSEIFTAPEVVETKLKPTIKSDLYSLGMILLRIFSETELRKDIVSERIIELWQTPACTGIAKITMDLLDKYPQKRALILQEYKSTFTLSNEYLCAKKVIESQMSVYREGYLHYYKNSTNHMSAAFAFNFDVISSIGHLGRAYNSGRSPFSDISRPQMICSLLNAICFGSIFTAFMLYTWADIDNYFGMDSPFSSSGATLLTAHYSNSIQIGDFWGNLPGRCVALSFAFVASRYYANIFSPLRIGGTGYLQEFMTNVVMRINSFSYALPICYAIMIDPKAWPICACVGTLFPALNNFMCFSLSARARDLSIKTFSVSALLKSYTQKFLRTYREWWILMSAYCLGIGAIGALLHYGIAQDQAIYAYFVCVVNITKIYRNNCGAEALNVSGQLARQFFDLRRYVATTKVRL